MVSSYDQSHVLNSSDVFSAEGLGQEEFAFDPADKAPLMIAS